MGDESPEKEDRLSPPRRRWWRDVLLGTVIFSCGFVAGGVVVTKYYVHRIQTIRQDGVNTEQAFARLRRALKLDDAQAEKVRTILHRGLADLRETRRAVSPEVKETLLGIRADVSAVLNERQRKMWEAKFDSVSEIWFPRLME